MVATNVKAETMSLMDKRSALEAEMNSIIARLSQPGAPGLSGNLVDSEVASLFHSLSLSLFSDFNSNLYSSFTRTSFSRVFPVPISTSPLFEPNDVAWQVFKIYSSNHCYVFSTASSQFSWVMMIFVLSLYRAAQ